MIKLQNLKKELRKYERPGQSQLLQRFFKTGAGEYGEGDVFLGLKTAETKNVAKKYQELSFADLKKLLGSKIHEERNAAIMILNLRFQKADLVGKKEIYNFYLKNYFGINNWDLVDISAPKIVGGYLWLSRESRQILYLFAKSNNLWKRRIAVMSTFYFIAKGEFQDALKISALFLQDKEDLIHKAVGWMLREVGKRDMATEEVFLKKYYQKMPRTMLRYAIEKFPEKKRRAYLRGKI